MIDMSNQVAVVLGAGGGLGGGIARFLARAGAGLVVSDIEEATLAAGAEELERLGAEVLPVRVDVSEPGDVHALAQRTLERFGRVDLVCNTVAVAVPGQAWSLTREDWDWLFAVNFWGVVHTVEAFVPVMIDQGHGHLVTTASTLALSSSPGNAAYAASKHAVLGFCEGLQHDLRAQGSPVKVSVLLPGAIRSRMADAGRNRPARFGASTMPPEKVAAALDYLQRMGGDPDVLAERILPQIAEGRFYIFGRPDDTELADLRPAALRSGAVVGPTDFSRRKG